MRTPFSIHQDQGLFRKKSPQVNFCATIGGSEAVRYVFVDRLTNDRWQLLSEVGGSADTELLDIFGSIGINRVGPDFFCRRNVRTGHDDPLSLGNSSCVSR